jgi:pimeloyl-ACP methyl ester carboxylesterase
VILVHGAGGRAEVWAPQLAGLADVARLIAVDLPGHGGTGGPGCRQVDDYVDWLVGLLDALGVDRTVVAGHSMGGAIAQTLALGHRDRLSGLVLVGTGARLRVLGRILQLFQEGSPHGPDLVASLSYSPKTPAGAVVEAERALLETPAAVTLGDFLACDRFDVMARLGRYRRPHPRPGRCRRPPHAAQVRRLPGPADSGRPPGGDRGRRALPPARAARRRERRPPRLPDHASLAARLLLSSQRHVPGPRPDRRRAQA